MKTVYSFFLTLVLLLPGLLLPRGVRAQEGSFQALPEFTNCFPKPSKARPASNGSSLVTARPQSVSSTNGSAVTPKGTLKVLVIFAGLTNDIDAAAPFYADPLGTNSWPQTDATHPVPGTTFPKNMNNDFYDDPNSFLPTATDHSLSNLFYQMSQHSASPFKMQAVFFPKRINVTANARDNRGGGFYKYTDDVLQALKNDPDTRNFDFGRVDKRAGTPGFNFDNSLLASDNVIDYTVIIWRNAGSVFGIHPDSAGAAFGNAGWASAGYGPNYVTNIPSANGQFYQIGEGFTQAFGMSGLSRETFIHEFAHTLYNSPHYFGANRSEGRYFNISEGPGMMGNLRTHFLANAWERWYNGWVELQTGATHVNSDIQGAASLTATNGEYTLRDYVTEGDVVRIKLPNSTQYLWLENHQYKSALDGRNGYEVGTRLPPNPLHDSPRGILAFVEDIAASRSDVQIGGIVGCNGLKVVSAQGNFDYTQGANLYSNNSYFWHNGTLNDDLYNFTNPVANPLGGESQITRRRIDLNGNNIILTNQHDGNVPYDPANPQLVTESTRSFIRGNANVGEDGIFGPDAAFNTVGQKMGNSYNPAIFEQQRYDLTTAKLAPIKLGGLSVELIAKDATTGAITIKVRYDDVSIVQNTRWSGDLQVQNVPGVTANDGADVRVTNYATLTINKSGTNNRHSKLAGEFINPTTLVCASGALFTLDNLGTVSLEGAKTSFQVDNGAELRIGTTSGFLVRAGAVLDIKSGGLVTMASSSGIRVEAGGTLIIRTGATVQGPGNIQVWGGGYICIESGAHLDTGPNITLDVAPNAILGANPALGLGALNCNSHLQFCGPMPGGNAELTSICPTGNEALLFDGSDDVVTIPQNLNGSGSPIHTIGQTFTIEASIRSDLAGGPNQTVFSNRQYDPSYGTRGLLFTLYAGKYLLLQLEGQNYYDFGDPLMQVAPNSGCHQVAVSRDASGQLHFYIDGQAAAYSPVSSLSPYSDADVRIGGDAPYSKQAFNGQIGEVRFWDIARTKTEILRYVSSTLATPQGGLMGYYDFRDATGQVVADKALIYFPGYNYNSPTGFLGSTPGPDSYDPTWVAAANLTCNVGGNFRQVYRGKALPDTTGQAVRHQQGIISSPAGTKHLSQLTLAPNPASGEAILHFQLRDAGKLEVQLQDLMGQARATALPPTTLEAGAHDVKLSLQKLTPGLYLVIVNSADGREVIRLDVK